MNHFVNFYIDNVINAFRVYNDSLFNVNIQGLGQFANKEDKTFAYLMSQLANCGFTVNLNGSYNIVVFLTICISYANNCFTL